MSKYNKNCYAHKFPVVLSFYCYVTNPLKTERLKVAIYLAQNVCQEFGKGFSGLFISTQNH